MKQLVTLAACTLAANAIAQSCSWNTDLVTPIVSISWSGSDPRPDGGTMAVLVPYDGLNDMLVLRLDPAGQVVWNKRFATTDGTIALQPSDVITTPDGGAVVYGVRHAGAYTNLFVLKLDPNGTKEWARIYMGMQSDHFYPQGAYAPHLAIVPSGGYVLSFPFEDGMYVCRLDGQGVPVWTKRYELDTTLFGRMYILNLIVEPDDEMMLGVAPSLGFGTRLLHLLPNGDLDWSLRYGTIGDDETKMERMANGDYVLGCINPITGMMRVDAAGNVLWYTDNQYYLHGDLSEMSNGDLLLTSDGGYLVELMRWQSDGTLIGGWSASVPGIEGFIGAYNDSLLFAWRVYDALYSHYEPQVLTVPTAGTLNCAFTATAVANTSPGLPTAYTGDAVFVNADTVKTWTLSLGDAIEMDQVDVGATLTTGGARPGFQHQIYARLANHFGEPSGPIDATMTVDPQVTVVTAVPLPTTTVGNTLTWVDLPSLDGFANIASMLHVTTLVPSTVPLGTVIPHTLTVTIDSVDENLANNAATISRTVTSSIDPNDKLVWPAGVYDMTTDSVLDYTINFQNTGTDTAFTVVVRDTLPAEVSVGSFVQGASSHPCTLQLNAEGVATWTLNNILLPDSNTNEALSHGLVSFRIKPDAGLPPGTVITNRANIYFDFNAPVQTPDATVVLSMPTLVPMLHTDRLMVHPVPVRDLLTVELPEGFVPVRMRMTTLEGRDVRSIDLREVHGRVAFPTHELTPGVYLMIVQDKSGRTATARFVKE